MTIAKDIEAIFIKGHVAETDSYPKLCEWTLGVEQLNKLRENENKASVKRNKHCEERKETACLKKVLI